MNILVGEDNDGSARVKTSHKLSFSTLALGAGWEVRAAVGGLKSREGYGVMFVMMKVTMRGESMRPSDREVISLTCDTQKAS